MPFVFAVLGILFLVVAIRGTQGDAFTLLKGEFVGKNSFVVFAAAIVILGALGYAQIIRKPADALIGLVILALILANKGGFFTQLNAALRAPVSPTAAAPAAGSNGTLPAATAAYDAGALAQGGATTAGPTSAANPSGAAPGTVQSGTPSTPWYTTLFRSLAGPSLFGSSPAY